MTYICGRCNKELEEYGGYAIIEGKNLCPICWGKYIEMINGHTRELKEWWDRRDEEMLHTGELPEVQSERETSQPLYKSDPPLPGDVSGVRNGS